MKTFSSKSPKNTYFAEINFAKPIAGLGSVISTSAMTLDAVKDQAERAYSDANTKVPAHVVVRENKATYPKFEWVVIKEYDI